MAKRRLIDVTEKRFFIDANNDVLEFIRRTSPFAHSDVGEVLFDLAKELDGAQAYCPSRTSMAYVVLHNDSDWILAIAFGMRGLAFRLGRDSRAKALSDDGMSAPAIGDDWVLFAPWDRELTAQTTKRLRHWCAQAFADSVRDLDQ